MDSVSAAAAAPEGRDADPDCCSARAVVAWAIGLGLVAGILELAAMVLKCRYLDPRNFNVSRHFPWMYPVSGVLVLLGPGLVLAVWGRVRRRGLSTASVVGTLSFFAYLGLLFRAPLYTAACLVLALGLAMQTARALRGRPRAGGRLVQWTLGPLAGLLIAAVAVAVSYERPARSGRQAAAPAPAPARRAKPKNVLLIVLDTVRARSLSLYGYGRKTSPNLERLAAGGVRFDHALSTAPWTGPSHASLFTGRWPHQLSIGWSQALDRTYPTLAEFLGARGYRTAGFVANTTYCSYETGLDRGFDHYEDYDVSPQAILLCSALVQRTLNFARSHAVPGLDGVTRTSVHRKSAARINADFLDWVSAGSGSQPAGQPEPDRAPPFFAFLNYYDAHHPYLSPDEADPPSPPAGACRPRSRADYALLRDWWDRDKQRLSPAEVGLVRDSYDRCVTYLDDQLGRLFDELARRRILDDTVVIVTADHGEHLGEQQLYGHGCSLYRSELHVPLLVLAPGTAPRGEAVAEPVSLRDIPATVVDLLGLSTGSPFPGRSLARAWADPDSTDPAGWLLSEVALPPEADPNGGRSPVCRGPMVSLVSGGWHYIRNGDGREELYDFQADPDEALDLAGTPEGAGVLRSLRAGLRR